MRKCVFAGTFDPPTLGHKALIEDCLTLFDEVAAAVMVTPRSCSWTIQSMVAAPSCTSPIL